MGTKSATYTLSVLLRLQDKLSKQLNTPVSGLRKLEKQADRTLKALGRSVPVSGISRYDLKLRDVIKDARSASRAADALNRNLSKPIKTSGLDAALRKSRALNRALKSTGASTDVGAGRAGARDKTPLPARRRRATRRGFFGRVEDVDSLFEATRQIKSAWSERADSLKPYVDQTKELYRAQEQFRALNLGDAANEKAFRSVKDTAQQIGGIKVSDLTSDLIGLKSVFGDLDTAIKMLPVAAKTRFTFQTLFESDPDQLEADILKTMKALEQMGAVRQMPGGGADIKRFGEYYDAVLKIKAYTGGRIGGEELMQFVGRGGVSAMGVSPRGLMHMASMMEAMGGASVGTSLMSAFQSFVAFRQGAGGARSADALMKLGLIDPKSKNIEWTKEGRVKKLMPGAMPIADLLGENPVAFADELAKAVRERGHKVLGKPVDMSNAGDIGRVLAQITGNRKTADVLAKMILLRENITKDVKAIEDSEGPEAMHERAQKSPLGDLQKYQASLDNFRAQMGGPMIEVATSLTRSLLPVAQFFSEHEQLTQFSAKAFLAAKGLGAIVETGALLSRGSRGIIGWFSQGATETDRLRAAITAAGSGAEGAAGSLGRAGARAGELGGKIRSLPPAWSISLALVGVPLVLEGIREVMDEHDKLEKKLGINRGAAQQEYNEGVASGRYYRNQPVTDEEGRAILDRLNPDKILTRALKRDEAGFPGPTEPMALFEPRPFGLYNPADSFNKWEAARKFESLAPMLHDVNIMKKVIELARSGELGVKQEGVKNFEQGLAVFDPKAYQSAIDALAEQQKALAEESKTGVQSLATLFKATDPLPSKLFSLGSALDSTAGRIRGLDIKPPIFSGSYDDSPKPSPSKPKTSFTERFRGSTFTDRFKGAPQSAIGSVVERSGLVSAHRGNVITPAALSRRAPGDWLDAAASFTTPQSDGFDDYAAAGGFVINAPVTIQIHDTKDADGVAARVQEELRRHRAELERMIESRTSPRRIHRALKHRMSVEGERA